MVIEGFKVIEALVIAVVVVIVVVVVVAVVAMLWIIYFHSPLRMWKGEDSVDDFLISHRYGKGVLFC